MNEDTKQIKGKAPWYMLFANDIMLPGENREEINQILDVWRLALEKKGLSINRNKTEYVEYKFENKEQLDDTRSGMTIDEDEIKEVKSFKSLECFVQKNGGFDKNGKHSIRCGFIYLFRMAFNTNQINYQTITKTIYNII